MSKKSKKEAVEQKPGAIETPKPPKEGNPLLAFLTVLLILTGISEVGLWGLFGFNTYQSSRAQRQLEERQKALAEELAAVGALGSSTYGPSIRVENGTITWRREDEPSGSGSLSGENLSSRQEGQKQLSSLSVPIIPYTLAEMDKGAQPSPEGTSGTAQDGAVTT